MLDSAAGGLSRGLARITGTTVGRYQAAVVRIGISLTWLLFLLREWPHRHELYGPDGAWSWDLADRLVAGNHAFTLLLWGRADVWFEVVYTGAILASVMLLLGWRTRTASLLFMIGVLSLQNRSVFVGDGGDNVIHLMAIYLVVTRCGQVWSLDSRRRARGREGDGAGIALWIVLGLVLAVAQMLGRTGLTWTDGLLPWLGWTPFLWGFLLLQAVWWAVRRYAPGEPRTVLDILANILHGAGLMVIVVEVCLIYSTAGWYKVQGSRWQDGTALYYPLHLDDFSPWPGLSHAMAASGLMVMVITYGTVIVQVAFPFTLFNRRVKNVLLALMMVEHASIAVVLGLPFFSLAMIAADAVFLPTGFLRWAGDRVARPLRRGGGAGAAADGAGEPADARVRDAEDTDDAEKAKDAERPKEAPARAVAGPRGPGPDGEPAPSNLVV
ncbi:HTTM domain-containing protein [Actinacidiphila glaucinigra]|uniref:HTTM domain-containing protein n=1 Tax=Actinacidiphila glaucinigra TaxID=235986 RepID=UPI0029B3216D|nr:HTTM domain-containing protein [Streptomyces sp. PA03-3a]